MGKRITYIEIIVPSLKIRFRIYIRIILRK